MATFRDTILNIVPGWLRGPFAERLLYALGLVNDAIGDATQAGVASRFPGENPGAFPRLGQQRRIARGFAESDDAYAVRLRRWLRSWDVAGNPIELMRQLQGYLSPFPVRIRCVTNAGAWTTLEADGSWSYHKAAAWDWDSGNVGPVEQAARRSRFWIIIYPPAELWTEGPNLDDPLLWGGAIGTPGYTIGSTATPEQVLDIQTIVSTWKSAASACQNIIIAFDSASFDPTQTGPGFPDGLWGKWGKDGDPARLGTAIYWDGEANDF